MTDKPKKKPPPKPPAGSGAKKKKAPKRGRGSFAWFLAGLGLSAALVLAGILWNAYSEPRIIFSPAIDIFTQKFSGYLLAGGLVSLAIICAGILRRRWAWLVPGGLALLGAIVAVATTVLLLLGGSLACGKSLFETASPDRRLLVVAARGNCGGSAGFTYSVVVRELGPSFPRQSTIFKSTDGPIPSEAIFSTGRTLTLHTAASNEKPGARYTVTIDPQSLRPDKLWRFRGGPLRGGS